MEIIDENLIDRILDKVQNGDITKYCVLPRTNGSIGYDLVMVDGKKYYVVQAGFEDRTGNVWKIFTNKSEVNKKANIIKRSMY